MIYSAGWCSVCAGAGDAFFVRCVSTERLFFACSSCGIAWAEPPVPCVVDTIDEPALFAPNGFTVATMAEIEAAGRRHLVRLEYPDRDAEGFEGVPGFQHRRIEGRAPAI